MPVASAPVVVSKPPVISWCMRSCSSSIVQRLLVVAVGVAPGEMRSSVGARRRRSNSAARKCWASSSISASAIASSTDIERWARASIASAQRRNVW